MENHPEYFEAPIENTNIYSIGELQEDFAVSIPVEIVPQWEKCQSLIQSISDKEYRDKLMAFAEQIVANIGLDEEGEEYFEQIYESFDVLERHRTELASSSAQGNDALQEGQVALKAILAFEAKFRNCIDETKIDHNASEPSSQEVIHEEGLSASNLKEQDESQEVGSLAERLTSVLNSDAFINELITFSPNHRETIIGSILAYHDLHKDGYGLSNFIEGLKSIEPSKLFHSEGVMEVKKIMFKSVMEKLELSESDSVESKRTIYEYLVREVGENGHFWHGFNGSFEASIKEKGLIPDERPWDWEEIGKLELICKRAGASMPFGWSSLNSEGNLFYSGNTSVTYNYAVSSPEWFSIFVGKGATSDQKHKSAFKRRDYQSAKENVLNFCDSMMGSTEEGIRARKEYPNITLDEKVAILDFFERHWTMFAGPSSTPKVALIKKGALNEYERESTLEAYCDFMQHDINKVDIKSIFNVILMGNHDARTQKTIPFAEIEVIDLPSYERVHPEVNEGESGK